VVLKYPVIMRKGEFGKSADKLLGIMSRLPALQNIPAGETVKIVDWDTTFHDEGRVALQTSPAFVVESHTLQKPESQDGEAPAFYKTRGHLAGKYHFPSIEFDGDMRVIGEKDEIRGTRLIRNG
jgi:hypothetical protein